MTKIILIGMKACGKTTIGKLLAQKLGVSFIELDREIEKSYKKNRQESLSCRNILIKYGEKYFRKLETETLTLLTETIHYTDFVLACGGGTPLGVSNQTILQNLGKIIFLDTSKKILLQRIKDSGIPAFFPDKKDLGKSLDKVLSQRLPIYNRLADVTVEINNNITSNNIVDKITHVRNFVKNRINGHTKIIGFFGSTYKTSKMYALYNAAFEAFGLNYVYVPFIVNDLKKAVEGIKHLGIKGVGVTIPYKIEIVKYLSGLDDNAKRIGAVNVVINENGKLIGGNTDGLGGIKALKEVTPIEGKKIILLGAGGAARALAFALTDEKANLIILNRTVKSAQQLAKQTKAKYGGLSALKKEIKNADVFINSTSLGMKPDEDKTLIDIKLLHKGLTVMDLVTSPKETKLIKEAKEKGCKIVYGERMLLWQSVLKFKMFTGVKAPIKIMEKSLC